MDERTDISECIRTAVDELRSLRCTDPAARRALEAIRLTAHTLEYFWLPTFADADHRELG